ncbi:YggS family pyridoxal phosphate-dependent enzyme [Pannus brasiliensis CCIBt3594]|uniref:Pyridoxal phosphate homeostasis protein n=1 Tax=Pannus brasiliensis CCIBt3594 TaxID=1427578 RepID=A0AAW9QT03_9CHRO
MTIAHRIDSIRRSLPPTVRPIAVTKQVPVERIREAIDAGITDLAESKLQEALPKQERFRDIPGLEWHFIGHLQANKARKVLETFDWIHSIDSRKLAERIDRLAGEMGLTPKVFLQVKVLPDPDKFGWEGDEILNDLDFLATREHLKIQGLMTILPLRLSDPEKLSAFERTRDLARTMADRSGLVLPHLSMGMSDDYKLAILAGATFIRLGTAIFGDRPG